MVACFRYSTIDVHSVYLPPSVLSFNYDNQDWIQREIDDIKNICDFLGYSFEISHFLIDSLFFFQAGGRESRASVF